MKRAEEKRSRREAELALGRKTVRQTMATNVIHEVIKPYGIPENALTISTEMDDAREWTVTIKWKDLEFTEPFFVFPSVELRATLALITP